MVVPDRWHALAVQLVVLAGCLPPSGYETARVAKSGFNRKTIAAEGSWTVGKRHSYPGQLGDVSGQHQPLFPVEATVMGRLSRGLPGRFEVDVASWNPFILPPLGIGGQAGIKWQLLDTRRLAAAIGARAGGYVHTFGQDGHSRTKLLGMADGRAVVSWDFHSQAALYLITRAGLESIRDTLTTEEESLTATGARRTYGVHLGLATDPTRSLLHLFELAVAFAPRSAEDPGFARFTVGFGRQSKLLE